MSNTLLEQIEIELRSALINKDLDAVATLSAAYQRIASVIKEEK